MSTSFVVGIRNPKSETQTKAEAGTPKGVVARGSGLRFRIWFFASCLALLTTTACHKQRGRVLGRPPRGEVRTILAVRAGDTPSEVTITGSMIEKCPVAGCWFRLRDRTGIIKVDTKASGFVVVSVPLQASVTVAGTIVNDGNDSILEATGLRY